MSAFFVSRNTIHDVVALCDEHGLVTDPGAFGRKLWNMNADAMEQRYPSIKDTDEARGYRGAAMAYIYHRPPTADGQDLSRAQLVKSLHCLTYQCSEGDVPERDLYRMLMRLEDALGRPALYDVAQWDRA